MNPNPMTEDEKAIWWMAGVATFRSFVEDEVRTTAPITNRDYGYAAAEAMNAADALIMEGRARLARPSDNDSHNGGER